MGNRTFFVIVGSLSLVGLALAYQDHWAFKLAAFCLLMAVAILVIRDL